MTEEEEREQFYKDVQKITPIEGVEYWNNGRMITVKGDFGVVSMDSYKYHKMLHEELKKSQNKK